MLRVETQATPNGLNIKLQGRFTGEDAENTRTLVPRSHYSVKLVVDITDVTFIDAVGEEVLSFFGQLGAEFDAETSYSRDICERLQLGLVPGGRWDAHTSGSSCKHTGGHARRLRQPVISD